MPGAGAEEAGPPQNPEFCSASGMCSSGKQPVRNRSVVTEASYREGNCPKCESAAELGKVISLLSGRLRGPSLHNVSACLPPITPK